MAWALSVGAWAVHLDQPTVLFAPLRCDALDGLSHLTTLQPSDGPPIDRPIGEEGPNR